MNSWAWFYGVLFWLTLVVANAALEQRNDLRDQMRYLNAQQVKP